MFVAPGRDKLGQLSNKNNSFSTSDAGSQRENCTANVNENEGVSL